MIYFYLLFAFLSFLAAFEDFLFFRIPNILVLSMFILFIIKTISFQDVSPPYEPFIIGVAFFVIGYFAYLFKFMGAGDVKFLSVAAMWASQVDLIFFVLGVGAIGGALALIYSNFGLSQWILLLRVRLIKFLVKVFGRERAVTLFGKESAHVIRHISKGTDPQGQRMIPYGVPTFCGCSLITALKILG